MRVAVMGAGSWGTTLAKVFADAGNNVCLWARRRELAETIASTRINPDYLPDIVLPDALEVTTDITTALDGADIVVCGVPSQTLRENITAWAPHIPGDATVLSI